MRVVKLIFLICLLAVVGYVAVAVPIGGQTLLERLRGVSIKSEAAKSPIPPLPPGTDDHTEADQQKLDLLIESKLGKEGK